MKNEINNLPQTTNQNNLVNIEIPQEKIDLVAALADENALWIKMNEGNFLYNGKIIPEVQGVIVSINPYYVQWVDKKPEKIPFNGQEVPEGYDLRCDLKLNVNGSIIGLSLAKTSTKTHLAPYLKFLKDSGLKPAGVVTRIRSRVVSSPHGKYSVAVFDCCGAIDDFQESIPSQEEPPIIDVSTTKKTTQPVQPSSNPWA